MHHRSLSPLATAAILLIPALLLSACGSDTAPVLQPSAGSFSVARLVSDTAAGGGTTVDPNLVNPWGVSFSPTHPYWVSDNGTGVVTLYGGAGVKQGLVVTIPGPGNAGKGSPTGQAFNSTTGFTLSSAGQAAPASFIFATEDGTIDAWNRNTGTTAAQPVDRSASGAVYKGLALASIGVSTFLYAPDFRNARVDVFDTNFQLVAGAPLAANAFSDSNIPSGFAPFNIANLNGVLYVSYAIQDALRHDDVPGPGNGFVDLFQPDGTLIRRLISRGPLNSPWGMVIAPPGFGSVGGALLVGNFGDGTISAFNLGNGAFMGRLNDRTGAPIKIDGLWTLTGAGGANGTPGAVYFTAGTDGEAHGLFGAISPTPGQVLARGRPEGDH